MGKQRPSWAEHAENLYKRGAFRSAALAFRVSLLQAPSSHHLMVMFARSLEKVNLHSPFLNYARKATMLAPEKLEAWRIFAQGAFNQRELGRAAAAASRQTILEPGNSSGGLMLARVRFQNRELDLCLGSLERAVVLAPSDKFPRMAQARCLFRLGRPHEALQAGEIAREFGARLDEFGFDLCRIARAANRPNIAEALLDKLELMDGKFTGKRQILDLTVSVDDLRAKRP